MNSRLATSAVGDGAGGVQLQVGRRASASMRCVICALIMSALVGGTEAAHQRSCAELIAEYKKVERFGDCPHDRHLVEQLYHKPECMKPGLRLCRSNVPRTWTANGSALTLLAANTHWGTADFAYHDAKSGRGTLLRSLDDAIEASIRGSVAGLSGIPKRGLQSWGARQWRFAEMQKFYDERLVDKYDRVWGIPLRRKHGSDQVKVALDVGGGAGRFAVALRDLFGITCLTLTQDNAPASHPTCGLKSGGHSCSKHAFDLPFVEAIVEERLPALIWSGADRVPLADRSLDLINSEAAVMNFSDDPDTFAAILLDWDRMLRPGGHVVIVGRMDEGNHPSFSTVLRELAVRMGWRALSFPDHDPKVPLPPGEYVFRKATAQEGDASKSPSPSRVSYGREPSHDDVIPLAGSFEAARPKQRAVDDATKAGPTAEAAPARGPTHGHARPSLKTLDPCAFNQTRAYVPRKLDGSNGGTHPAELCGSAALWPPRTGSPRPDVDWDRVGRCLTAEVKREDATYSLQFSPPCTLRAEVRVHVGGVMESCPLILDVCRQHELLSLMRSHMPARAGAGDTTAAASCAPTEQTPLLWDGAPLGVHWREARHFGPEAIEKIADLFNAAANTNEWAAQASQVSRAQASPRYRTCAIVGGSPTLKGRGLGKEIDGHAAVWRYNDHPFGGAWTADYGRRATVHVVQNQKSGVTDDLRPVMMNSDELDLVLQVMYGNENTLRNAVHAMAHGVRRRHDNHSDTANGNVTAHRLRVLSADALLAFHQIASPANSFTGTLGVFASLALCEEPPTLYGFSTMRTDLSRGFTHYYRKPLAISKNVREQMGGRLAKDIMWMHALECLGHVHIVSE